MFRIYAAVDIKDGKCVRLYQGDLQKKTVYSSRPWEMAIAWETQGASYLHVVDLDGAAANSLVNLESIRDILERVHVPVQVGGGVRNKEDIERLLSIGVTRVVLGTRALTESAFLADVVTTFGSRVIVSVDTRQGEVAVSGWKRKANRSLVEIIKQLIGCGAQHVIHTDISRDGTLRGYDVAVLEPLLDRKLGIIAAGGISNPVDLLRLKALMPRGVEGAIVGRALYSGDLKLEDVLHLEEE